MHKRRWLSTVASLLAPGARAVGHSREGVASSVPRTIEAVETVGG